MNKCIIVLHTQKDISNNAIHKMIIDIVDMYLDPKAEKPGVLLYQRDVDNEKVLSEIKTSIVCNDYPYMMMDKFECKPGEISDAFIITDRERSNFGIYFDLTSHKLSPDRIRFLLVEEYS